MRQQQKIHKTNQNKISITTTSVGGDDDYNDAADDDYSNDEYDDNYNNVYLKVKVEMFKQRFPHFSMSLLSDACDQT